MGRRRKRGEVVSERELKIYIGSKKETEGERGRKRERERDRDRETYQNKRGE